MYYLSQYFKGNSGSDQMNVNADEDWEDWCNINPDLMVSQRASLTGNQPELIEDYKSLSELENAGWESAKNLRSDGILPDLVGEGNPEDENGSEKVVKTEEVEVAVGEAVNPDNPWLNPKDMERLRFKLKVLSNQR